MIHDLKVDDGYREKNKRRMDYFVPNYLERFIKRSDIICSVGCGTGYDVELLNEMGYDVYGLDLGSRVVDWQNRSADVRRRLREGFADDLPFGRERFDFIYALEVIEHVGCKDGRWELESNYREVRERFLSSCIEMLRPGGRVLISTSNRLFPVDVGHAHHYSKITNYTSKYGLNLTIPWDSRNFIVSFGDLRNLLRNTEYWGQLQITQQSSYGYPSNSKNKYRVASSYLVNSFLYLFSMYPLIRLNPILVVLITKNE